MRFLIPSYDNRESIKHICDEMGHYHQCQNDFLDVFNVDGILQKTSHDIEIGKCSWLAVTCMRRANYEQKQILIENYKKKGSIHKIHFQCIEIRDSFSYFSLFPLIAVYLDPECINRVKQLYIDMNMFEVYREFAYGKYDSIRALIATAECEDPIKNVLYKMVDLLFHRSYNQFKSQIK